MRELGFSLVELSIVLVILGLLTGGILAGQSLIRAAELRAVPTEYSRYTSAVHTFRDKYFAIPGDMTNATAFWTVAGGTTGRDNACIAAMRLSTTTGTCNGNGNGSLIVDSLIWEQYTFWNHLSRAGLIEGNYYYLPSDSNTWVTGREFPASKLNSRAGWMPCYTDRGNFGRGSQNMFILSAPTWSSAACYLGNSADLRSDEAYSLDVKMDDGLATTGTMTATNSYNGSGCITGVFTGELPTASYVLSSNGKPCHLYFQMD